MNRRIGVIMSGLLMVFEMLSTLLYTPYLIRTLGQSEYGVYTLVFSITAYLTLLDLGVGNAVVRYVSKYRVDGAYEEQRHFLGVAVGYYGVIAAVALLVGAVIILFFPNLFAKGLAASEIVLAKKLMTITVLNIGVTLATSPYMYILTAYEKFFMSKGISIIQVVFKMAVCTLVLYLGMGSVGVVLVNFILTFLLRFAIVAYVSFGLKLRPKFAKTSAKFIKSIAGYSSWILLQMIATQINQMADQVLIGMFAASSSVIIGVYGVGAQINQYFQSVGSAFTGVLMPGVVKIVEKDGSAQVLQKEMERIGRIVLMVTAFIWCVFLVCGEQFVSLWAGAENVRAYWVALLLMAPQVFILAQSVGAQILWAMEKHRFQAVLKFIIVLVNVFLTIFLIKIWDPLLGATVGTFISLVLGDIVVMQIVFKKDIGIQLLPYYKNLLRGILPCLLFSLLAGFAVKYFLPVSGWFGFILNGGTMVLVYGATMLWFGMNSYEKQLLFSPIQKAMQHIRK